MRIWAAEGYATLDFQAREGTLVRPSDPLRRGEIDLAGVDMTNPAQVKEHLFGNLLRVDKAHPTGREPLALELEEFLAAVRTGARPRVGGDEALRAMRLAGQILHSMETHEWEGLPTGPTGPQHLPPPVTAHTSSVLRGPVSWRTRQGRSSSSGTPAC
jgi:predicted dehydrogenase